MTCVLPAGPRPMTTPAERAQVYFANARLPAPLPTPPRSKMLPLLPTPCLVILPTSPSKSPPPSRADAVERWDAGKNAAKAAAPVPGRADAAERWDAHKKAKPAPATTSPASSSSSDGATSRASTSSQRSNSNRRRATSRAASAERWDARKQPRPVQVHDEELDDDDKSSTGSNDMELHTPSKQQGFYGGPGFLASPEPGMLPMPSFMVRVA